MKNYKTFINESNNRTYVAIDDYLMKYFGGDKQKFVNWLNTFCTNKSVIYVNNNEDEINRGFVTRDFIINGRNRIQVNMINGQNGMPKALLFNDTIPIPNTNSKPRRSPEVDPYDEEDWGWEEA